jgi:hypothetical protein
MSASSVLKWHYHPGQELSLVSDSLPLVTYHFATDRHKPYLHPIHTTDGLLMTSFEPWDHVWHRGVWFSWKFLNGVNYWEERPDEQTFGRTVFIGPESVVLTPDGAVIRTRLQYLPPEGDAVLDEHREVRLSMPRPDGNFTIDWRQVFTPTSGGVVLDRVPINQKTPWGGYAGIGWRASRTLGHFRALDSHGRRDRAVQHQRAAWADLSGTSDGGWGLAAGIALFDHPDNPRHPNHWVCLLGAGFGYLNPSPVQTEPYVLEEGTALTLTYRVLVHREFGNAALLEDEFRRFCAV